MRSRDDLPRPRSCLQRARLLMRWLERQLNQVFFHLQVLLSIRLLGGERLLLFSVRPERRAMGLPEQRRGLRCCPLLAPLSLNLGPKRIPESSAW